MKVTEKFMTQFVSDVYDNLCTSSNAWCDLRDFRLHIDDYKNNNSQQYYLLKYFPAYFTEYYTIYEELFSKELPMNISVASVGCGAGIDFYALTHLLRIEELEHKLRYVGIDCVRWDYLPDDPRFRLENCLLSELDDNMEYDFDVWMFPKSWTEFAAEDARHLAGLIGETEKEKIYILNSYVTDDSANNEHVNFGAFPIFHRELLRHGFEVDGDAKTYTHWSRNAGYRSFYSFFKYPDDVLESVRSLKDMCPVNGDEDDCEQCDLRIFPMLNSKYGAWTVLEYTR